MSAIVMPTLQLQELQRDGAPDGYLEIHVVDADRHPGEPNKPSVRGSTNRTTAPGRATRACCAAVTVLALGAIPDAETQPPRTEAVRLMQAVADADGLPSISVAVAKAGSVVFSRALGLADVEHHVPATPATVIPIGAVTKSLTAVAALQLAERDRIDLDAPVQQHCPAFPVHETPITVRQLLGHTGDIRHYDYRRFDEDFLNTRHFNSIDDALVKFAGDDLVGPPGGQFHYSSWGYVVVGCAIEGASGMPYAASLEENISRAVALQHTRLDVVTAIVPARAGGYARTERRDERPLPVGRRAQYARRSRAVRQWVAATAARG